MYVCTYIVVGSVVEYRAKQGEQADRHRQTDRDTHTEMRQRDRDRDRNVQLMGKELKAK